MNQLVINNCSASGATSEWDFHSELENNTYSPEHNTIAEETEREYVPGTFEGPEKTLEVIFKAGEGIAGGLRNLDRAQLDELCTQARCTILSKASTAHLDAYVLSESSLFVYDYRLIMKTCGTTTLLRCLSILFEYADKLGMQLSWVGYSRKNFLFPTAQLWPHVNFGEEMRYIEQHESLQSRLRGDGHILGPVTGDHWFVYVAEGKGGSPLTTPRLSSSSASPAYGASRSELSGLDRDRAGRSSTSSLPTVLAAAEARDSRSASLSSSGTTSGGSGRGSDSPEAHDAEGEDSRCSLDKAEDHGCCIPSVPSVLSTYTACTDDGAQMKAELTLALSQLHTHRHSTYRTFNMMMFDMAPEAAATFFQSQNGLSGKEMTRVSGICDLCPGYVIDEAAFEPCGYSMNAVRDSSYATIHITPEAQCSYVSFETNECLDDYTPLLRRVLATFRPARFVLTMFGDDDAIACLPRLPTANRAYGSIKGRPEDACYLRTSSTCTTVESQRQQCIMAVYSYQAPTQAPSPTAESPVAAL